MIHSFKIVALSALLLASMSSARAQYSLQGMGGVPSSGAFAGLATRVSSDGSVVVGGTNQSTGIFASIWTPSTGAVPIGELPGGTISSSANGVSSNGGVAVGGSDSTLGEQAFRWTPSGGMVGLGDLPGTGLFSSIAEGVSADGQVVVGVTGHGAGASLFNAWRWTPATGMTKINGFAGGDGFAEALAVSADGNVVVGASTIAGGSDQAFRWTTSGGLVGLGDLPGGQFSSMARSVSADGSVIVGSGSSTAGGQAFRWTAAGGMQNLGALPGPDQSSGAIDVSADGSVIVGITNGAEDGGGRAFVWFQPVGMLDLRQYLIDHGRTIAGAGINPAGITEGWIAHIDFDTTLPPPPPPPVDTTETFVPSAFSVLAGTLSGGSVAQLSTSDNSYVTLRSKATSPMQVTIDGTAAHANATTLTISVEAAAQGSTTRQDLALFDFVANAWVTVDSRTASSSDGVIQTSPASPTRFIQPGTLKVRARLTFTPSGKKTTTTTARIDRVAWTRVP